VPSEHKRREITWAPCDELANRFANILIKKGIQKGDKVIHLMMNSIDWLAACFGIVRTEAWAVPLNFRFTGSDIEYCCEVAEPKLIVFGEEFTERMDRIKDCLSTVKHYIFVGKENPSYAEPYDRLMERSSPSPPTFTLITMTPVVSILPPARQGKPNLFF
jgi:acyl-CoA synthetase (AMP-forming)/AMP-acid ligase II